MSTWVEIHCDVEKQGLDPENHLLQFCWSDRNDNPSGWSIRDAKDAAIESGWKLSRGNLATCPNCAGSEKPFFYDDECSVDAGIVGEGRDRG